MARRITIIQDHPDPARDRFCHALADAYAAGAETAGLEVKRIEVAKLEFPLLRTQADFEKGSPLPQVAGAQEAIRWAEHLVIIYPLWRRETAGPRGKRAMKPLISRASEHVQ